MRSSLKAVLFDHDGTIVDSESTHFRIWNEVLQPYGVQLPEEEYERYYAGVPTPVNAADLVRSFGLSVSPAVLADAKNVTTRLYLAQQAPPLMPGSREAIDLFRGLGLQLAIVTGAGKFGVDATLQTHALHDAFATVVTSDDVRNSKPAPDSYLLAMKRLGVSPDECIAIEDTEYGVAAACGAGVACLAVPTALSARQDFSRATGVFRDLGEATQWVLSLL